MLKTANMNQFEQWRKLVASQFRKEFHFPPNMAQNWFPGHMHKGLRQMQRRLKDVDCIIEVHDARIPLSGRNITFKDTILGPRPHILVLNKEDLIPKAGRSEIIKKLKEQDQDLTKVIFTNGSHGKCPGIRSLLPSAVKAIESSNRYHRTGMPEKSVIVIGIPNVGKSTIINQLRSVNMHISRKAAPVGARPGITRSVQEKIRVCDDPIVYLLDTPGISKPNIKNLDVGMRLAACHTLSDEVVGYEFLCDYILWWLNSRGKFEYVKYMNLKEPEDDGKLMLAKAAIAANKLVHKKVVSMGSKRQAFPDYQYAAHRFLGGFRSGAFGLINMDDDLMGESYQQMVEKTSKSAGLRSSL